MYIIEKYKDILTKDKLYSWYIEQNLTSGKIASLIGCDGQTVLNYLHKHNIKVRRPAKPPTTKIGDKFGKLTVVDMYRKPDSHGMYCKYQCDCGTCGELKAHRITQRMSCGCSHKQKREKHRDWKGYAEISGIHFCAIRQGASNRGLEFNITIEQIWNLFLKQNRKCALTGEEISFYPIKTASLDRKNSKKGYIIGNIQWVHKYINVAKSDMSDIEYINWCYKVCKHSGKIS